MILEITGFYLCLTIGIFTYNWIFLELNVKNTWNNDFLWQVLWICVFQRRRWGVAHQTTWRSYKILMDSVYCVRYLLGRLHYTQEGEVRVWSKSFFVQVFFNLLMQRGVLLMNFQCTKTKGGHGSIIVAH